MLGTPDLINIDNKKCDQCFTCVKNCPVKAIYTSEDIRYPKVQNKRCIGCGLCVDTCRPAAITYRSAIAEAKHILGSENNKVAVISPAISAEFNDVTDYRKFVSMVKALGFNHVHEVTFGIDIIASFYKDFLTDFRGRYYITSCDPVVVAYVEKFHPSLVNNLVPYVSPMIAMAKVLRSIYPPKTRIVYIGSGIASKDEALKYEGDSTVNCVLTFAELRKLFADQQVDESTLDFADFAKPHGYKGLLFPIVNGMVQAAEIDENLLHSRTISIEGISNMIQAIEEFEKSVKIIHRNLHIMSGNKLAGPGISNKGNQLFKEYLVIKYAQKRIKDFDKEAWDKDMEQFLKLDYSCSFTPNDQRLPEPSKEDIRAAMQALRKIKGHEANCGRCGYASCHEFAKDMANGIVTAEMCATYTLRYNEEYNKTVVDLNKQVGELEAELKKAKSKVRDMEDSASQKAELTDAMLEKLRAGVVMVDSKLQVVKANKTFARILGEEALDIFDIVPGLEGADLKKMFPQDICQLFTYVLENAESIDSRDVRYGENILNLSIFSFHENRIAGAVVRDMSAPEVQKTEVVKRISDVINTNLKMVQKIGFLLGENAADVERMLNSIIEFYDSDRIGLAESESLPKNTD
ncbi:MAG: 4Fe-4S dicluster domain-containing protein [Bacteroidales bacterium]|nr:4Fe-4S dicluster domain-containing protein [Bacteroidales bacterium]